MEEGGNEPTAQHSEQKQGMGREDAVLLDLQGSAHNDGGHQHGKEGPNDLGQN
jgi:hypothetical protein